MGRANVSRPRDVSEPRTEKREQSFLLKLGVVLVLVAALLSQRHRVVGAIRAFSLLPGSGDRAEMAALRVAPLLEAELSVMDLKLGDPVFLRIFKEEQALEVWMKPAQDDEFQHYKTYRLCRPAGSPGPRVARGDQQAPEGFYYATLRSLRPRHRYHLGFDIGFPNAYDRHHGRSGERVFVQGACVGQGSLALANPSMEEVYTLAAAALESGQEFFRIHCFPFRMSDRRMNRVLEKPPEWLDFWANLKEGYDYFEILRRPPNTTLVQGEYFFE